MALQTYRTREPGPYCPDTGQAQITSIPAPAASCGDDVLAGNSLNVEVDSNAGISGVLRLNSSSGGDGRPAYGGSRCRTAEGAVGTRTLTGTAADIV